MGPIRQRLSDRSSRPVGGWDSYEQRFQDSTAVDSYDKIYSGAGSFEADLWKLAIPTVRDLIGQFQPADGSEFKVLDFACGTGRISEVAESIGVGVIGVDISAAMLEVAATRCPNSTFIAGDLTSAEFRAEHDLGDFDLALAFRFFLNAQPDLKSAAMAAIRIAIKPGGHFIVNNHRSSPSLHAVWVQLKRRLGRGDDNILSAKAFEKLLTDSGFQIVDRIGHHVLHGAVYRSSSLGRPALGLEAKLMSRDATAGSSWRRRLGRFGAEQIYVCKAV